MLDLWSKVRLYGLRRSCVYAVSEFSRVTWSQAVRRSFSQSGEDLVIDDALGNKAGGFYVDVGANHPTRFSNTRRFYDRGWHGINIEPNVTSFARFTRSRPRDINLNCGVGPEQKDLPFYRFNPDTLSTFSTMDAERYVSDGFQLIETVPVPVFTLRTILQRHAPKVIDFISVDTEGLDLEVLASNDWERFRPKVVCVESATCSLRTPQQNSSAELHSLLRAVRYSPIFDNGLNLIYIDELA